MAHQLKVETVPLKNKDGSDSKTKKQYRIWDSTRGGRRLVETCLSKKGVELAINKERTRLIEAHRAKHPNDQHFARKHQLA